MVQNSLLQGFKSDKLILALAEAFAPIKAQPPVGELATFKPAK